MADDEAGKKGHTKVVIRNIGLVLSGELKTPILDADTVVVIDGLISRVGKERDLDCSGATTIINANGTTMAPGLIDSHVHPVAGDWTPRQNQIGWIDSYLHGGVTTMISAGEVHTPGRPKDVVGLKAMAIYAQRSFNSFRPGGVRIYAGAPAIPGSSLIDKDIVLETDADVIGHINGGHTALPDDQITELCEKSTRALEIVHNGNERAALLTHRTVKELKQLKRVILGTDSPAGSGV